MTELNQADLHAVVAQVNVVQRDIAEMNEALKQLASSMQRLAVAEERINYVNEAIGRSFKQTDLSNERVVLLERRIVALEIGQTGSQRAVTIVDKAMLGGVAFLIAMSAAKLFGGH
jgi:hypothetical protein